jgi:hypothetical protein
MKSPCGALRELLPVTLFPLGLATLAVGYGLLMAYTK